MSENPLYQAREIHKTPAELTKYKEDFCTACAMRKSTSKTAIRSDDVIDELAIEDKFHVDFTGPNPTEFLCSEAQKLRSSDAQKLRSLEAQ